jgi:MSHA pilin protein MshD
MSNSRASGGQIRRHLARGFTIIEMIVAVVVIGVGVAGLLSAVSMSTRSSADPTVRIQLQAVAEQLMEEVLLKSYAAGTPATVTGCERSAFDELSDYDNYATSNKVCNVDGTTIAELNGYSVKINVAAGTLSGVSAAKKVSITVSRGNESFMLVSWRTDYAS